MGVERRQFPRLRAPVLWRMAGLRSRFRSVDVSLGGMRIYSDDRLDIGAHVELELLVDGEDGVEVTARVVWIEPLGKDGPAAYDVGLEFLEVTDAAKRHLEGLLHD